MFKYKLFKQKIINLYNFIITYVYTQVCSSKYLIKSMIFGNNYNINCYTELMNFKQIKIINVNIVKVNTNKCIYLCNHRDAADFFIDGYLTNGASYIGLIKTLFYFPFSVFLCLYNRCIILFLLKFSNRQKLFNTTKKMLETNSVIIYPEGSRNIENVSLPLRYGFIKFAYENNIPIQIIITKNKEHVFSAKMIKSYNNVVLYTSISEVIYPKDYYNVILWNSKIKETWDKHWNMVY